MKIPKLRNKHKFYSLDAIMSYDCTYNMIFGERSSGKTYAVLYHALRNYVERGEKLAIVRRWQEDLRGKRGASMFDALIANNEIEKLTNGRYNTVHYYAGRWCLSRFDDELQERVDDSQPFAYAFAITNSEHDKSSSYPDITTILFDEFLTRTHYLDNEFVMFMNVISTIVRHRDNVKIFMLGNTVNQYCPYFSEMGLNHIKKMKPGDIDVYTYGDSRLKVAVEYTKPSTTGKSSDYYFAFDNPKLRMITSGAWELAIYPHLPIKYRPKDIIFIFFVIFNGDCLQCEVVNINDLVFLYIHRKTTPLKSSDTDLIFSTDYDPRPNWRRNILKPQYSVENKIIKLLKSDKVFYQDNETGEILRNYLTWCTSDSIIRK